MSALRPVSRTLRAILPTSIFNALVEFYYVLARIKIRHWDRSSWRLVNSRGMKLRYYPDHMWTVNGNSFDNDPRFFQAWARAKKYNPSCRQIFWRIHMVLAFADYCKTLEGDFVECGTLRGIYSHAIIEYINFKNLDKKFYLFDTWTGMDTSQLSANEKEKHGHFVYEDLYSEVVKNYADVPNVILTQGSVPSVLEKINWGKICFLHLDMNNRAPEVAAANFFWDKLVPGGVIISDDYGHPGYEEQKQGFEEFARSKGVGVLSLPTGTGVILKPRV